MFLIWLWLLRGNPVGFDDRHVFFWLETLSKRGVILGGVSGGPVILALAGLMENYRMTVHWEHVAPLVETVPGLLLEHTLIRARSQPHYLCGGGIAALDMMHALIDWQQGVMLD